jgi:hypothetical protein
MNHLSSLIQRLTSMKLLGAFNALWADFPVSLSSITFPSSISPWTCNAWKIKNKILKETIYKQMMNALTEYKVFESKSRTLSFCWVRSTFAKLSISSAIEGYLDPLDMSTTCKQTHDIRIFIFWKRLYLYNLFDCSWCN